MRVQTAHPGRYDVCAGGSLVGSGMSDDDDPMLKPDGHRYEAPESRETTVNKEVVYAVLAVVVVVLRAS